MSQEAQVRWEGTCNWESDPKTAHLFLPLACRCVTGPGQEDLADISKSSHSLQGWPFYPLMSANGIDFNLLTLVVREAVENKHMALLRGEKSLR